MKDGSYLLDLYFNLRLVKNEIEAQKPNWEDITERSALMLKATKDYYDTVAHPPCAFSLDKDAEKRGQDIITKLELLDTKASSKDQTASKDAVKHLEKHLDSILQ